MIYTILLLMYLSPSSSYTDKEIVIHELSNQQIVDGCGCYLSFVQNDRIVFANDYSDTAWININGIDTKIVQYKSTQLNEDLKVGSKFAVYYSNDQYKVEIDYTDTSVCGKDDEGCEFTGMDAVLTVLSSKSKKSVKLIGGCGC